MSIDFSIDKDAKRAAYRQIISGITAMVRDGKLNPGNKLPSERELALMLDVSRGTAKKAYDKLCTNGVCQSVVGSGTYISMGQDVINTNRKQQAIKSIENLTDELTALGFSYREIETHFNLVMNKYLTDSKLVNIATIDCSPEALYTFEQQLDYIQQISIEKILLSDIEEKEIPVGFFEKFDLILTTSTHYEEICRLLPSQSEKIMQAVLSPERETVIELAQIPKNKQVGAISLSERYLNVILGFMTRDVMKRNTLILNNQKIKIDEFYKDKDYLVLPPKHILNEGNLEGLSGYLGRGGIIINFNYQIERGSLIYIEEKISDILHKKLGGRNE